MSDLTSGREVLTSGRVGGLNPSQMTPEAAVLQLNGGSELILLVKSPSKTCKPKRIPDPLSYSETYMHPSVHSSTIYKSM